MPDLPKPFYEEPGITIYHGDCREILPVVPGYQILNLGAGVQSTTVYLRYLRGEIEPQIDAAIFADTQEEPGAVYRHLEWLKSLGGPPIIIRTAGKLGEHLMAGRNSTGGRFASIPAFTSAVEGECGGMLRRQCSKEYKAEVIERAIRRDILGLKPRQRIPKGVVVTQIFGISMDEAGRAARIARRLSDRPWAKTRFPLLEGNQMTRSECICELADKVPHETPRSACVFCPFRSDAEWRRLRDTDPDAWNRAVAIDEALRVPGIVFNRGLKQKAYLHRTCVPLQRVSFLNDRQMQFNNFNLECEGMCGI